MISAPDDYGLTPEQTLAHTAQIEPAEDFETFWNDFREEVSSLSPRWQGTLSEPANEIIMNSLRNVRFCARVSLPNCEPRGVVVTSHGYEAEEGFGDEPEPWSELGMVTVRVRVRGYPPSCMDIEDLRADWIMHGIELAEAWILRGAVADVMQACRGARMAFGEELPLIMHGESFGGGLAVLAGAQLGLMGKAPQRMVLGLPTFGDWAWRAAHYCNGSGGQVNMLLDSWREENREELLHNLGLFDAALHAKSIKCPVLCKLAHRDDVVPAPSAASIYNALGSNMKWVFPTKYGHFDGGLSDLRRHGLFERLHPVFSDPHEDPQVLMATRESELTL